MIQPAGGPDDGAAPVTPMLVQLDDCGRCGQATLRPSTALMVHIVDAPHAPAVVTSTCTHCASALAVAPDGETTWTIVLRGAQLVVG